MTGRLRFKHLCFILSLLGSVEVHAQDTDLLANDVAGSGEVLPEVVVIGEKGEKPLSETAASVAIVDAQRVQDYRLYSLGDAFRQMANVSAPQFTDGGFVIRGINTEAPDAENISGNQTPMATIYLDGVALTQGGARRGPMGMWDVEQVEVFRGPQSTLQGRNSLAGAVHIHTKDPTFHWEGASRTTYGSMNTFDQAFMLSGPLSESLAFRFAGEASTAESQVDYAPLRHQPRYDDFIHSESYNLRFKLLYQQPGDDSFSALLSYNHSYSSPSANDVFGPNAPGGSNHLSFYDRRWLLNSPALQVREAHSDLASLELNWKLDNGWRIFSQTSFSRTETNINAINNDFIRDDVENEITQEIRAHYQSDKTKAVVGFYSNLALAESTQADIERQRLNLALFGEVDHEFAPRWHAILGARLDSDDFRFSSASAPTADSYFLRLLPKGALRYEFTPNHSLSFNVQQGYRSGGAGADVGGNVYTFDPSTTWNYELALRSLWLDGKLQTNLNVFYTTWKDQQVVLRDMDLTTFAASERVINAAQSELGGVELETRLQATPELSLFLSGGYLTTAYKDFTHDINPATAAALGIPARLDYAGYDFPESPRFDVSVGFDYHHKSGFFFTADAEASSSYYSPYLFAPAGSGVGAAASVQIPQNEVVRVAGRVIVNTSLGYERENWSITFFVRNLFDQDYLIGKTPNLVAGGGGVQFQDDFLATVGQPRFFGISVNLKF